MKPLTEGSEVTVTVGDEIEWNDCGIICQKHCALSMKRNSGLVCLLVVV